MNTTIKAAALAALATFGLMPTTAFAETVALSKLTGTTGTAPSAATAVYRGDLGTFTGTFQSITIRDSSGNFGGAAGQFSGFDLDAIKLSTVFCTDAACAASATSLAVFDFIGGTIFTAGMQRDPADPKLFGTGPGGNTLDDGVATLGLFDGVANTLDPNGFISLGDNGVISFNLSSALAGSGLYLYIGEVGDNGEIAGSNIVLNQGLVPEPDTWAMLILGFGILGATMRRRSIRQHQTGAARFGY